jgi:hypothetical protein
MEYEFEEQIEVDGIQLDAYFGGRATVENDGKGWPLITAIIVDGHKTTRNRLQSGLLHTRRIGSVVRLDKPTGKAETLSQHLFVALAAAIEGWGFIDRWRDHLEDERADAS